MTGGLVFDPSDLDSAERWVDNWQAGFDERAAQAQELANRLSGLTSSARSEDGLIKVTVGTSGALVGLELDEGIREQSAQETARDILTTLAAAQAAMAKAATVVATETVGADTETGRAVIAVFEAREQQ
jgi:DNA-binding protein YbaB